MEQIEHHFKAIMQTLGLDLNDDSLNGTPKRVAKMYVKEIFSGLNPANKPKVALFDNTYRYGQMLDVKNISFYSNCEHHFVPIFGKAHVGYISSGKVIGLSKLNRIVDYYARRPQVQERLTMQIARELEDALETKDVAVLMDAKHLCVASRGVKDNSSSTVSSYYGGKFNTDEVRREFLKYIELNTQNNGFIDELADHLERLFRATGRHGLHEASVLVVPGFPSVLDRELSLDELSVGTRLPAPQDLILFAFGIETAQRDEHRFELRHEWP